MPILIGWLFPLFNYAQIQDSLQTKIIDAQQTVPTRNTDSNGAIVKSQTSYNKPEILSGGFIDFIQNGQMNASARLFRLFIGEPGKFQVPVSVYTGVSANNLSSHRQKEDIIFQLINPGTGIINMSFDGNNRIIGKKTKITSFRLQYQAGFRFINSFDRLLYKNIIYSNFITGGGFILITGAWEKTKQNNIGVFWFNLRGLFSHNPPELFRNFFTVPVTHNLLAYSAGMGIEISQALNVKIFYFHFLNNRDVPEFVKPFLQLGFNYSLM